jgi:hypothetical protein
VLIDLDGDNAGVELGEKVVASIDIGKSSLLGRWLAPSDEAAAIPRFAFVEDPTEVREPSGAGPALGEAAEAQFASERPSAQGESGAN